MIYIFHNDFFVHVSQLVYFGGVRIVDCAYILKMKTSHLFNDQFKLV